MEKKAIIFTHLPHRMKSETDSYDSTVRTNLIDRFVPYYEEYLKCRNVGLIYVYVDTGIQLTLEHLLEIKAGEKIPLMYSIAELEFEQNTRNCLKLAVRQAKQNLKNSGQCPEVTPKFQFIGLPHLSALINSFYKNNPELLKYLAGPNKKFTYDSPKFVESIIRLGREEQYPILRFDADVKVNEEGIQKILDEVFKIPQKAFAFLSGGYGKLDAPLDPVNDFAVRLHWLVDVDKYNKGQNTKNAELIEESLDENGYTFLRDLGEIGATQLAQNYSTSLAMNAFIKNNREGKSANRNCQQVISGAGLFMTKNAIEVLPPFMSFQNLTIWVDDHLKRRLHEALGQMSKKNLEHINDALFHQDRHPEGIKKIANQDIDGKKMLNDYFDRLFRGCILHSLIMLPDGEQGLLSETIAKFLPPCEGILIESELKDIFSQEAIKIADSILTVWKNTEYYGNNNLREWATSLSEYKDSLIASLVCDAVSYVKLVCKWKLFTGAIERLQDYQAFWLFRDF